MGSIASPLQRSAPHGLETPVMHEQNTIASPRSIPVQPVRRGINHHISSPLVLSEMNAADYQRQRDEPCMPTLTHTHSLHCNRQLHDIYEDISESDAEFSVQQADVYSVDMNSMGSVGLSGPEHSPVLRKTPGVTSRHEDSPHYNKSASHHMTGPYTAYYNHAATAQRDKATSVMLPKIPKTQKASQKNNSYINNAVIKYHQRMQDREKASALKMSNGRHQNVHYDSLEALSEENLHPTRHDNHDIDPSYYNQPPTQSNRLKELTAWPVEGYGPDYDEVHEENEPRKFSRNAAKPNHPVKQFAPIRLAGRLYVLEGSGHAEHAHRFVEKQEYRDSSATYESENYEDMSGIEDSFRT